jgi:hypothetical protein
MCLAYQTPDEWDSSSSELNACSEHFKLRRAGKLHTVVHLMATYTTDGSKFKRPLRLECFWQLCALYLNLNHHLPAQRALPWRLWHPFYPPYDVAQGPACGSDAGFGRRCDLFRSWNSRLPRVPSVPFAAIESASCPPSVCSKELRKLHSTPPTVVE